MHQGSYVFSQVMGTVVRYQFNQCVDRYRGNYRVKRLACWEQFLALCFGQLAMRESLRDVVTCLAAHEEKHYHLGFRSAIKLPTLARANERRDWRMWRDYAEILIQEAQSVYGSELPDDLDLDGSVYVIDSTTIELCLSLFPWADLARERSAIKLHVAFSLAGNIPSFFDFSRGREADMVFLDRLQIRPGAYYVLDRGYIDYQRLHTIHTSQAFFVIRAKDNLKFRRQYSRRSDKRAGIQCDQVGVLTGEVTSQRYPHQLRRVKYRDAETGRTYVYLTNNRTIPAATIALLYKYRWQIELFFKWVKQHLAIKAFWGRSENAVKTQVCIALCAYLLVAIVKKKLCIERNSYEILQILSVSLLDKTNLGKLLSEFELQTPGQETEKQATLWDI